MQGEWSQFFIHLLDVMEFTGISKVRLRSYSQLLSSMLFMKTYIFCASVRLGVILISIFALLKTIILMSIFTTQGLGFIFSLISKFNDNLSHRASYYMVRDTINFFEHYPEIATFFLQLYSIGHGIACVVAGYGAYNLKRYFVLPLAFFEFVFIVEIIGITVLFLRIIRHFVSLEKLIVLTVTAAAYAIFVVYDFFVLLAFEQIMSLVRSKQYQQFYGSDPLNPVINATTVNYPNAIHSTPTADKCKHKWWKLSTIKHISDERLTDADVDAHKYFQSRELLSDILLHNGINKF